MKIKSLLIGMLACTALVGCTSEDSLDVNNGNGNENNEKAASYVRVKLMMTDSYGSRSTTDGGYDVGKAYEQNIDISKSVFLFYDADGQYVTAGKLVDNALNKNEDGTHHANSTTDADGNTTTTTDINSVYGEKFIALSASEDAVKKITQVLTVINYHDIESLKNIPLKEAYLATTTDATDEDPAFAGTTNETTDENGTKTEGSGYLMSTSVYYDGNNNLVYTTAIGEDNIQPTQALAYADEHVVKIYIERAAAKVELKSNTGSWIFDVEPTYNNATAENETADENTEADILLDEVLTPVKVKVLGWTINNYNLKTNVVKQVAAENAWSTTAPYTGWNNASDHRSYWALDNQYGYKGSPDITTLAAHNEALETKSFTDAMNNSNLDALYCYEHAVAKDADNVEEDRENVVAYPNVTTVLVAGQILLPDGDDDDTEADVATLYKYNSIYYTEANYKGIVESYLRKYKDADDKILDKAKWNVTLKSKTVEGKFVFSIDVTTVDEDQVIKLDGETVTIADVVADVENKFVKTTEQTTNDEGEVTSENVTIHTEVFTEGYCYYQIPIEHLSSTDDARLYGVIRNHWYQLTINAIAHVGEAVGDPDLDIPEIPKKETAYYMAAELHVLSWHVVEQSVTLE